jgi:hypothetical protein
MKPIMITAICDPTYVWDDDPSDHSIDFISEVDKILSREKVVILEKNNNSSKIRTSRNRIGWVKNIHIDYL